jgi:ADP-heptose:LPS heptosyltransferase
VKKGTKYLVFCQQGLGDVVMTLPLLLTLQSNCDPQHRMLVVVKSKIESDLLRLFKEFEDITIVSWRTSGWLSTLQKTRAMRPDIILAPHSNRKLKHAFVKRLLPARKIIVYDGFWSSLLGFRDRLKPMRGEHKVTYFLRFAQRVGIPVCFPDRSIMGRLLSTNDLGLDAIEMAQDVRWIVLGPGSGEVEHHKRWPRAFFAKIAE